MRWFLGSVGLAILATIILIVLYSEAKAETWACSHLNLGINEPKSLVVVRDGKTFIGKPYGTEYRILDETEYTLHLYHHDPDPAGVMRDIPLFMLIWKKAGRFTQVMFGGMHENVSIHGTCTTY